MTDLEKLALFCLITAFGMFIVGIVIGMRIQRKKELEGGRGSNNQVGSAAAKPKNGGTR